MKENQGFSLLEVLIAIGLLSTIAGFSVYSVSRQLDDKKKYQETTDLHKEVHQTLTRITEDMRHAYLIQKEDYGVANLNSRIVKPLFVKKNEGLIFSTMANVSLVPNSPQSDLSIVWYYEKPLPPDKKQLIRKWDTNFKDNIETSEGAQEQVLIQDLKNFKVKFWTGTDFTDAWSSLTGDYANRLPKLAHIHIEANPASSQNSFELESYVYLLYSVGQPDPKTPLKEYPWK